MKYKNSSCAWCGNEAVDITHVPGKFLIPINERNNNNWPKLPACKDCNQGIKLDEEWFTLHFANILSDYSNVANVIFNTAVKKHIQHSPPIGKKYLKRLNLVNLNIDNVDYGLKTKVTITDEDWDRITHVIEMYTRGLYFWHTQETAKDLKTKIVYINPELFRKFVPIIKLLTIVELFPITFEYAYTIRKENTVAIFLFLIYNKPSFIVSLVNDKKYQELEDKIQNGDIIVDETPIIEILG